MPTPDPQAADEPTDPDIDPAAPPAVAGATTGGVARREQLPVLAVIACGGGLGAAARYGAGLVWPTADGAFPWTTLVVNALGCTAIGVFMVVVTDIWTAHRLLRPFFGTGVLGGFTTFSTYTLDIQELVSAGQVRAALGYLALTAAVAMAAVWLGATATRRAWAGRGVR
jgi:CrcB protein